MVKINEDWFDDFMFYSSFYSYINRYREDKELCLEMFFALADYWATGKLPDKNLNVATLWLMDIAMPNIDAKKRHYKSWQKWWQNHTWNQYTQWDKKRYPNWKANKSTMEVPSTNEDNSSELISSVVEDINVEENDSKKIVKSKKSISQLWSTIEPSGSTNTNTNTKTTTKTTTITREQIWIIKQMINDMFKTMWWYLWDDEDESFIELIVTDELFKKFCNYRNKKPFDSIKLFIIVASSQARDWRFYPIQTFKHLYEKLNIYISRAYDY